MKGIPAPGWMVRCVLTVFVTIFGFSAFAHSQFIQIVNGIPVDANAQTQPGGLLTVDEAVQNAVIDFERHGERGDWQKAFRVLENLPAEKRVGMLPMGNGFMVPSRVKLWRMLVDVNAEGRQAFRLFYEPKAKQLYTQMQGQLASNPAEAFKNAELIYDQYFITSYGDDVANLLGDVAFEKGQFIEAANRWKSIVDYHTDTDLSVPQLLVKSASAYVGAGRALEAQQLLGQLKQRHAQAQVKVAGREWSAVEYVTGLLGGSVRMGTENVGGASTELKLGQENLKKSWEVSFNSAKGRSALKAAVSQNYYYRSGFETMVPNHANDGQRVFVNWLGIIFAVDVQSGKLLWRTEPFEKIHPHFNEMQQGRVDLSRYDIQVIGEQVFATMVPLDRLNYWQPAVMLSTWNAQSGAKGWASGGDQNGQLSYIGRVYPWNGGGLIVSHQQQQANMTLNFLNLSTGKSEWTMPLGTITGKQNPYSGGQVFPVPEYGEIGRQLCLMTNSGSILQISPGEKKIDGQFRLYEQPTTTNQQNYYYNAAPSEETQLHTRGRMLVRDGLLLFKEVGRTELYCVDIQSQNVLWKRPTVSSAMIVDVDDRFIYLMNSELSAHSRVDGKLVWSVKLPIAGGGLSIASGPKTAFVATRRGLFEIDKNDGRIVRIVRTDETDVAGISMQLIGDHLVTISDHAVTGYSLALGAAASTSVLPDTSTSASEGQP